MAASFQLSLPEIETPFEFFYTSAFCMSIAQFFSHPLNVLAARVQYAPYYLLEDLRQANRNVFKAAIHIWKS
jgi:hypothetical protein